MDSLDRLNFFRDRFNIISFIECKKVIELLNKNGCEFSHIVHGDMLGEIKLVFIDENYNEFIVSRKDYYDEDGLKPLIVKY